MKVILLTPLHQKLLKIIVKLQCEKDRKIEYDCESRSGFICESKHYLPGGCRCGWNVCISIG
jgi:hypothetical protein